MDGRSGLRQTSVDPRKDYSRIERKPSHKWTIEQHVSLVFLARSYENSWKEITKIFNISELGHPDRLSSGALASMYHDIKRGNTGKDAVKLLRGTAFSFTTEPTLVDQDSIERTATKLGIHLIKRLPGALSKSPKMQRRAKRKAVVLDEDTDFLSERLSPPRAPKSRQHPASLLRTPESLGARNSLPTPPTTVSHRPVPTSKKLPAVAYRAFSSQSMGSYSECQGFRAGAFVDLDIPIPLPPDAESEEYISEAKRVE